MDTANAAYAAEGDPAQTERGRPRPPADVLDAERAEYTLEDEYAATQQTAADELVIPYKALGGGLGTEPVAAADPPSAACDRSRLPSGC